MSAAPDRVRSRYERERDALTERLRARRFWCVTALAASPCIAAVAAVGPLVNPEFTALRAALFSLVALVVSWAPAAETFAAVRRARRRLDTAARDLTAARHGA